MDGQKLSDIYLPAYNIKAVAQMVGLLPVTLRAWERRYGLPNPERGGQGYRLYSEHDLQTLRWLKSQIESGMNIGQAARKLNQMRESGNDPTLRDTPPPEKTLSLENLRTSLMDNLLRLNEQTASDTLRQAFSLYSTDQVFCQVVKPVMDEVGESWHRKELPVALEHFVSHFFQEHLIGLLSVAPQPFQNGVIVAACLPGEFHQIGLLIIVVMLRMRGWNVVFLGPDLPLDRLEEVLIPLQTRLLLFSATMADSARNVSELPGLLQRLPDPAPRVVLGGKGFENLPSDINIPYSVLADNPKTAIEQIEELMHQRLG